MPPNKDISTRVCQCLRKFLESSGRPDEHLTDQTNLYSGLGFTSDEGLDLVLDLCDEFDFEFPTDFNPVVHRDGKRGNKVSELIAEVIQYLKQAEVTA